MVAIINTIIAVADNEMAPLSAGAGVAATGGVVDATGAIVGGAGTSVASAVHSGKHSRHA